MALRRPRKPTPTKLQHRIDVLALTRTPDGAGGWSESWGTVATIHAAVEPFRGSERYLAQQQTPGVEWRLTTRYREDISASDTRVEWKGRQYDVVSVYDPDGARRWLVLEIAEVVR